MVIDYYSKNETVSFSKFVATVVESCYNLFAWLPFAAVTVWNAERPA
jgi:protein involved in sex pheromone biosynthesis